MQNKNRSNNRYLRPAFFYPIILFFLVFFDGSLMSSFSNLLSFSGWYILPNLTLIGLFYTVHFRSDRKFAFWWWTAAIGLIFDLYYTQAIGTYLIAYLVSAYTMFFIDQRIPYRLSATLWTLASGFVIFYILVFIAGSLTGQVDMPFANYIIFTVLPTIVFNSLIELLFYRPVESLTYIINN